MARRLPVVTANRYGTKELAERAAVPDQPEIGREPSPAYPPGARRCGPAGGADAAGRDGPAVPLGRCAAETLSVLERVGSEKARVPRRRASWAPPPSASVEQPPWFPRCGPDRWPHRGCGQCPAPGGGPRTGDRSVMETVLGGAMSIRGQVASRESAGHARPQYPGVLRGGCRSGGRAERGFAPHTMEAWSNQWYHAAGLLAPPHGICSTVWKGFLPYSCARAHAG